MLSRIALVALLLAPAPRAQAQPSDADVTAEPGLDPAAETDCVDAVHASLAGDAPPVSARIRPSPNEDSPAVADLSDAACLDALRSSGVPFHPLEDAEAGGVGIPIRLDGELAGIRIGSRGHAELHEIMDCRLAVALLRWAPRLRSAGVAGLVHYSTYRPGARVQSTGQRSGHAAALAIDLAALVMEDGSEIDVLSAWESRGRGLDPCDVEHEESERSASLRRLVCSTRELFQVVLTPHYDAAHANHVHLELRPEVEWTYVR